MMGTILVVGSLNMDLVVQLNRWPEPDETVLGRTYRALPGGKGANQAVAAAKQAATAHMLGCVGQDEFGKSLLSNLRLAHVDVEAVRTANRSTGVALVGIEPGGQSRIIVVPGANRTVTVRHVEDERERLAQCDWLLLQLEIPMEANIAAAQLARRIGTKVILTPSPVPSYTLPEELLEHVDIIVPNRVEARALTGKTDPSAAAEALRRRGIDTVIVTLGDEGALLADERGLHEIPAFEVEVIDTTAAGDAFVGALAVALSSLKAIDEAVRYATAAGALTVTKVGAQPALPTLEEVEALLAMVEGNAPKEYPDSLVTIFETDKGEEIIIRPILPADAPRLKKTFEELSPESIYRRFFTHRRNLSSEEARNFATVDYEQQLALVAAPASLPDHIVGVARFAPTEDRSQAVEMAIVVTDAYQGHGIGGQLFSELVAAAREIGHRWMLVETQPDNQRMIDLAEGVGYRTESEQSGTITRIWIDLTQKR